MTVLDTNCRRRPSDDCAATWVLPCRCRVVVSTYVLCFAALFAPCGFNRRLFSAAQGVSPAGSLVCLASLLCGPLRAHRHFIWLAAPRGRAAFYSRLRSAIIAMRSTTRPSAHGPGRLGESWASQWCLRRSSVASSLRARLALGLLCHVPVCALLGTASFGLSRSRATGSAHPRPRGIILFRLPCSLTWG